MITLWFLCPFLVLIMKGDDVEQEFMYHGIRLLLSIAQISLDPGYWMTIIASSIYLSSSHMRSCVISGIRSEQYTSMILYLGRRLLCTCCSLAVNVSDG